MNIQYKVLFANLLDLVGSLLQKIQLKKNQGTNQSEVAGF